MIVCSICNAENHHLAATCASCGGYLQNRTENLDLFATCWGVIERPARTFRMIALSRRKNFAAAVAALAGIGMVFALFWAVAAGEYAPSTLSLFVAGIAVGPAVGLLLLAFHALLVKAMAGTQGVPLGTKNAFAVYSYAMVPVALSVLVLLPVEIISFGRFFFTVQPSPYSLRPLAYVVLIGLDSLCALWTLLLLLAGTQVLLDVSWRRALVIVGVPLLLLLGGVIGAVRLFLAKGAA
jgi:hypothetical protein